MKRRTSFAFAVLGLVVVALSTRPAAAQDDTSPATLDEWLSEARSRGGYPAIAAAISDSEGLLAIGASGLRDANSEAEVTAADLWHIGSITKSFTSLLVARLAEQGLVSFDQTLGELDPELAADTPYAGVTIEQLLSHRSGLPANPGPAFFLGARVDERSLPEQRREVMEQMIASEPVHAPGTGFLYSNSGYMVVGSILESLTGRPWEDLLTEHVLVPLGLESAGFGAPGSLEAVDQPRGHRQQSANELQAARPDLAADNPAALGPAGTLHMSVADLSRYTREQLRGELGQSDFVSTESWKRMHRRLGEEHYALGWVDVEAPWISFRRAIWHNGSNTMWYAITALLPEDDLTVTVVTNAPIQKARDVDMTMAQLVGYWRASNG